MTNSKSLNEIQENIRSGFRVSALVDQYLKRIEETKDLNIYIEVFAEDAKKQAEILDDKIAAGKEVGKLAGCIVSIKDVLCYKDHKVSAASKILDEFTSPYSATAINNLIAEDAIIIGRTNCDEFGMGSANTNSIYGATKNGIDDTRVPGGSSGGAAVSVQQNTCLIALGSDTGGSVRQPASFCGVYGLKPTYGKVSRYGLIAYASSFDQIGIIGHNPEDIAATLEVISGKDKMDATSTEGFSTVDNKDLKDLKIGVFDSLINHTSLDHEIKNNLDIELTKLSKAGSTITNYPFKYADYLVPTYYVLTTAEASTNLSRYDGVRYGHRSDSSETLEDMYVNTRTEGFGKEVKRRIILGTYVLSEGYYDAYFNKAQQSRRLIHDEIEKVLEENDIIILPTSTNLPWELNQNDLDPVSIYLSDMYTVIANLTGMPCISVPTGNNKDGLPFGIQLLSNKFNEQLLLSIAKKIAEIV